MNEAVEMKITQKTNFMNSVLGRIAALLLLSVPLAGTAIEFDEIREYGDVFRISAQALSRDLIEVRWDIEPDYYLYNNKFLEFTSATPGVVIGEPLIPPGEKKYDELLGEEVIKFHGSLTISLPLDPVPAGLQSLTLNVRSQGCLENVLCYPPTLQVLTVGLPAAAGAEPAARLSALLGDPLVMNAPGPIESAQPLQAEDAFIYEAIGLSAETILVRFTAQPGYYLYVDKFAFRMVGADGFQVHSVSLPQGTIKDDPEFGPVPVIYGQVAAIRCEGAGSPNMSSKASPACGRSRRRSDLIALPRTRQSVDRSAGSVSVARCPQSSRSIASMEFATTRGSPSWRAASSIRSGAGPGTSASIATA